MRSADLRLDTPLHPADFSRPVPTEAKCPWCTGRKSNSWWLNRGKSQFSLLCCATCRLLYTSPQLPPQEIAHWYGQSYYGEQNSRFNFIFETLITWFRRRRAARLCKYRTAPGAVLDIGCGRGHFLSALRESGWSCTGTELSETAAQHARDVLKLDVHTGPFSDGSFPNSSFDAIYLWHVLEHIASTKDALTSVRRILRPGGMLVIALPNVESWQARLCRYGWFHLDLPRHYVHCSAAWLVETLISLGFRIMEVNHFSFEQNVYGWIQSMLNCSRLKTNLLYDILKRKSAREIDRPLRRHPVQSIISIIFAAALLPAAIVAAVLEAIFRRGGTIEIYAESP